MVNGIAILTTSNSFLNLGRRSTNLTKGLTGEYLEHCRWIQKTKYDITIDNFNPSAQAFTYITYKSRYVKSRKTGKIIRTKTAVKVVNMETPVYLKKQMYLWGFIDELKQDLEGGN